MKRVDPVALRFELLRTRAAVQRAELRSSVLALDRGTRPLRNLLQNVFGAAHRLENRRPGASSMLGTVLGFVRERPWLVSAVTAALARRRSRRWLLLGGVALAAAWVARAIRARLQEREYLIEDYY